MLTNLEFQTYLVSAIVLSLFWDLEGSGTYFWIYMIGDQISGSTTKFGSIIANILGKTCFLLRKPKYRNEICDFNRQ
jgi:hypothetical protein